MGKSHSKCRYRYWIFELMVVWGRLPKVQRAGSHVTTVADDSETVALESKIPSSIPLLKVGC